MKQLIDSVVCVVEFPNEDPLIHTESDIRRYAILYKEEGYSREMFSEGMFRIGVPEDKIDICLQIFDNVQVPTENNK